MFENFANTPWNHTHPLVTVSIFMLLPRTSPSLMYPAVSMVTPSSSSTFSESSTPLWVQVWCLCVCRPPPLPCCTNAFPEEGASPAWRRGLDEPSRHGNAEAGRELRASKALPLISVVTVLSKVVSRVLAGDSQTGKTWEGNDEDFYWFWIYWIYWMNWFYWFYFSCFSIIELNINYYILYIYIYS